MNYLRPDLLHRLAAAYALGTLQPAAMRRFARVVQQSRVAQQAVDTWHDRLNLLAVSVPPVEPSAHVWHAIAQRTHGATNRSAASGGWQPQMSMSMG